MRALQSFLSQFQFIIGLAEWDSSRNRSAIDGEVDSAFLSSFQNEFRLGSFGVKPIVEVLYLVDKLIRDTGHLYLTIADCNAIIDTIDPYARALAQPLETFRSITPRALFDPPSFSSLRSLLTSTPNARVSYFVVRSSYQLSIIVCIC